MLNHLDASVASGPTSMAVVAAGVTASEEGLCFAGAFLLGALPSQDNLALIDAALEDSPAPRLSGIAAALVHAPDSEELRRFVRRAIDDQRPSVQAMGVFVAGVRRQDEVLRSRLPVLAGSPDPHLAKAVAEACRRVRVEEAAVELQALLAHESRLVRKAAVLALLRAAPGQTAAYARSHIEADADFDGGLALCLGISGQPRDVPILIERSLRNPKDRHLVEALGVLGMPASIPHLLSLLAFGDDEVVLAAATALDLISGLHATERTMVAVSPDQGDTFVETHEIERVNVSADFWTSWWHRQTSRLDTTLRWRRGDYFSIGSCIDEIADSMSTYDERSRAYLELAARAPVDIPFDAFWFVPRQEESINAWRSWWTEHQGG
jgi:HEAT repeat protein